MNKHLFTNFDTRFIDAADLVLQAMADSKYDEFMMDHKYSNLRLPRQCGKSTYLKQLVTQLTTCHPTRAKLKIAFFAHNAINWADNIDIAVYNTSNHYDLSKFDVDIFTNNNYDILLFDEVSPTFTAQLVHHQQCQDMAARSTQFLAFGMHSMDFTL
jgi:hypothetical protein